MKILPVSNYQTQSYNKKQDPNFGKFKVNGDEKKILEELNNLCSCTSVEIMHDFRNNLLFLNKELQQAFNGDEWSKEVIKIGDRDLTKLKKLTKGKAPEEASRILTEYLTTGQVVIF